jgi:alkylation response protein AidB-like acyl-CoA dehydrogenase
MTPLRFEHFPLPKEAELLRQEVRTFLRGCSATWMPMRRARSWDGLDPEFSRQVGARSGIGMTWPKSHSGSGRSALLANARRVILARRAASLIRGQSSIHGAEHDNDRHT